jgi:hypothetical protein
MTFADKCKCHGSQILINDAVILAFLFLNEIKYVIEI